MSSLIFVLPSGEGDSTYNKPFNLTKQGQIEALRGAFLKIMKCQML